MICHQQDALLVRDVLDPLHLHPEPVAVEELVHDLVDHPFNPLGAAPVGDRALGLQTRQLLAEVIPGRRKVGTPELDDRSLFLTHGSDSRSPG